MGYVLLLVPSSTCTDPSLSRCARASSSRKRPARHAVSFHRHNSPRPQCLWPSPPPSVALTVTPTVRRCHRHRQRSSPSPSMSAAITLAIRRHCLWPAQVHHLQSDSPLPSSPPSSPSPVFTVRYRRLWWPAQVRRRFHTFTLLFTLRCFLTLATAFLTRSLSRSCVCCHRHCHPSTLCICVVSFV